LSRAALARALLALAVLAVSTFVVLTTSPRLGLDLRGGTQLVLRTSDTDTTRADADATDRALEVLRRRVDALGVAEPSLVRAGSNRIIVELPGVQDPAEAVAVLGRTARLTVHPVLAPEPGAATVPDEAGTPVRLGPVALDGAAIEDATAAPGARTAAWEVTVGFRGDAQRAWQQLTGAAACHPYADPRRRVAIALDGAVISSPRVDPQVGCRAGIAGGSTVITGDFDAAGARELALLVRAGALPVPVELVEQRTVGATLGAGAIEASARAAVLGIAMTALFMLAVYRLAGLLAVIGLAAYGLISYAVLLALGATLTLPGIAGFVLAIGMAIDANVLVFERAREEFAAHGRLRRAVRDGFRGALSAVADSNVTTLLAAGLLFWLATGPVRGFGVTLSVGVLVSMFTALVLGRTLLELLGASRVPARWTGLGDVGAVRRWLLRRRPELMRHGRRWLTVSGLLVVIATAGIGVRGLALGVEFTGGRLVEYSTSQAVDLDDARRVVAEAGVGQALVNSSGDQRVTVRAGELDDGEKAAVTAGLARLGGAVEPVRDEFIGPGLGSELRTKALIALAVAVAGQLVYLAVRFRPAFGAAAVLAMVHDVVVVVGAAAWLGLPVDANFLAALLTVIGYSVNDSVVLFDRVRELLRGRGRTPVPDIATSAILQTLPRTVNTGFGAVVVLVALVLLGGDTLTDFALSLLIGVVVGTWSSVFTATPLAVRFLGDRPRSWPRPRPVPGPRRDSGARV
jgi:SecD/SecF fusion protein